MKKQTFDENLTKKEKIAQIFRKCFSDVKTSYVIDRQYLEFTLTEQLKAFTSYECNTKALIELIDRLEHSLNKLTSVKDIPNVLQRHNTLRQRALRIKKELEDKIARVNQLLGNVDDMAMKISE